MKITNLQKELTTEEIVLMKQAGIKIKDKDYTKDDLRYFESQITDYIMSQSSKNGDISKAQNEYIRIFRVITEQ